jgi:hypothetical protein
MFEKEWAFFHVIIIKRDYTMSQKWYIHNLLILLHRLQNRYNFINPYLYA